MRRDRTLHGIEHWHSMHYLAEPAWRHTRHDARAVINAPLSVETRLPASDALHDDTRGLIDQYAHVNAFARAPAVSSTINLTASFSVVPRGT